MSSYSVDTPDSHKSQLIFQDHKRQRFSSALIIILIVNLACILIFAVIFDRMYVNQRARFNQQQLHLNAAHNLQHTFQQQVHEWTRLLLHAQTQKSFDNRLAAYRKQEALFQEQCTALTHSHVPVHVTHSFSALLDEHKKLSVIYDAAIKDLSGPQPDFAAAENKTSEINQPLAQTLQDIYTSINHYCHDVEALVWDKLYRFGCIFVGALLLLNIFTITLSSLLNRRMYRHLAQHERRLQNVMQAAPVGILLFDPKGVFCDANRSGMNLLDYQDSNTAWHDSIHPDDRPFFLESLQRSLLDQETTHHEFRIRRSDQSIRWLAFNATPEKHEDIITGYIACLDDITTAKAVEELLRSNEERLRIMLHALTDGVIATDTQGRIQDINPSAELLCALKHGEAIGQNIDDVCHIIDRNAQEIIRNPIFTALEQQDMVNVEGGWALLAQDDSRYEIDGSAAPIFNDQGELVGSVLVMRDITDQISLQHRLRHAEKMQSIGQLTGGIAHDFNNMLGAIMGAAQILDTLTANSNDQKREYIQVIMRVSENAAELVRNLLTLSRKSAVEESELLITDVVEQTVEIARHAIRKNIDIQYTQPEELLYCRGDQAALQSSLLNLFINAQDAMPNGGTLSISISNKRLEAKKWQAEFPHIKDQLYTNIVIKDTGTGIPEEIRERIFEPFFTTKERGKGTGLGLAAVYGTINSHDGCISVSSQTGEGTRFSLYLPQIPIPANHHSSTHMPIVSRTPNNSVLIIDDDENLRPILASLVSSLGYHIFDASSGNDGINVYREHQSEIKVILLDLVMPHLSGRETFDQIRAINPEAKIILISGYDRGADSEYLLEHGAIAYLRKPFSMHDLAELLDQHIDLLKD